MARRLTAALLLVALSVSTPGAVDAHRAQYVGGTVQGIKEHAEGALDTVNEYALGFDAKKDGMLAIPYAAITELEYGQKAGRRVGAAATTTVLLGPVGLLGLASKKRNHYLTITYLDAQEKEQAAIFELGKGIVRTSLKIIETRSGKRVLYQDEEARKSGVGGG